MAEQVEIWFGNITRQSIRRGTLSSVKVLINQIRNYIDHWNANAKPFVWTATADEILAKVRVVQTTSRSLSTTCKVTEIGLQDTSWVNSVSQVNAPSGPDWQISRSCTRVDH